MLAEALVEEAPVHLRLTYRFAEDQRRLARDVIARFGRHPHRNAVLGRICTPAEEAYVATGALPHLREVPQTAEAMEQLLARRGG